VDAAGNLYVSDEGGVHKISPDGAYATVFARPSYGIAVDSAGNLYIADQFSCRIRRLSQAGVMTTVAGNGTCGYSGDGGPATAAQLFFPLALAVDQAGNVYFVDEGTAVRVRRVSPDGIITTVAGGGSGELLDGSVATSGKLSEVIGLAADSTGNLYFQEFSVFYPTFLEIQRRVRKISPDGVVTTVAGTGDPGYSAMAGPPFWRFSIASTSFTGPSFTGLNQLNVQVPTGVPPDLLCQCG
jgi:sugar lactone lactonase YvrE